MDDETQVKPEDLETQEQTETGETTDTLTPEEVQALREKAAKADELESKNKQLFERLQKEKGKEPEKEKTDLSSEDIFTLVKSGIEQEDLQTVKDYARFTGKTVSEVLQDKTLKTILNERNEERRSAAVANTRGQRGSSTATPEQLMEKASQGALPESDIDKLAAARMEARLSKAKS